jgi:hypothetical protein
MFSIRVPQGFELNQSREADVKLPDFEKLMILPLLARAS